MTKGQTGGEEVVHFLEGLKDMFYFDSLSEIDQLITKHFEQEADYLSDAD